MKLVIKNSFLFLILSFSLLACSDENRYYEKNVDIENSKWNRDTIPEFTFDIQDTSQTYHLIYNLRNGKNYPFYNLYLESELIDSTGLIVSTFFKEIYLFDANSGEPFGENTNFMGAALGDVYDGRYMCQPYYKFPKPGKYTFSIKQFMRNKKPLEDILAVGIRLELPLKK